MKVRIISDTAKGIANEEIDLTTCPEFHKFKRESLKPLMELREKILSTVFDYWIRVKGISPDSIDDDGHIIKSIDFGDFYL